jgi:hypothetical protein
LRAELGDALPLLGQGSIERAQGPAKAPLIRIGKGEKLPIEGPSGSLGWAMVVGHRGAPHPLGKR